MTKKLNTRKCGKGGCWIERTGGEGVLNDGELVEHLLAGDGAARVLGVAAQGERLGSTRNKGENRKHGEYGHDERAQKTHSKQIKRATKWVG